MLRATAGQEDPFELDTNLLLSSGRHGEDRKRQYFCTTMKHRYLTIWLTYCTSLALPRLVLQINLHSVRGCLTPLVVLDSGRLLLF